MCLLGLSTIAVSRRVTRSGKSALAQASRSILLCGWLSATSIPSMTLICQLHPLNAKPYNEGFLEKLLLILMH